MMLQKVMQFSTGETIASIVADEPRCGESQEVFEARMLMMLEKVYGMVIPRPTNPSLYREPEE